MLYRILPILTDVIWSFPQSRHAEIIPHTACFMSFRIIRSLTRYPASASESLLSTQRVWFSIAITACLPFMWAGRVAVLFLLSQNGPLACTNPFILPLFVAYFSRHHYGDLCRFVILKIFLLTSMQGDKYTVRQAERPSHDIKVICFL